MLCVLDHIISVLSDSYQLNLYEFTINVVTNGVMKKSPQIFSAESILAIKIVGINLATITGAVIIGEHFEQMGNQFGESGFVTYFSVVQLLILSYFTYRTFQIKARRIKFPWKSSIAIWGIMSLGFFFLALDDLVQIHESIDGAIHWIGQIDETGVSDRIDDLIVGLYGIIAIGLLVCYRRELKKHYRVLPYIIIGFALLFLMVGVDVLTNRNDILLTLFSAKTTGSLMGWLPILEESCKILSEAFLIVAAYTCYQTVKSQNECIIAPPQQSLPNDPAPNDPASSAPSKRPTPSQGVIFTHRDKR